MNVLGERVLLQGATRTCLRNATAFRCCSNVTTDELKDFSKIPGPRSFPIIGTRWRYYIGDYSFKRLHRTYDKMYAQYGYLAREKMFEGRTLLHVFHPVDIKKVYDETSDLAHRQSHKVMMQYRRERPELYDCAGLGPSNGEEWMKFRSSFKTVFQSDVLKQHEKNIEAITDDLIRRIKESLNRKNETDIKLLLFRWALEIVGQVLMNRRLGALDKVENARMTKLITAAHTTHDVIYKTENKKDIPNKLYQKFVDAQDYSFELINEIIENCLADPKCKDSFVTRNMARDDVSKKDVRTFVMDLFQGGMHSVPYSVSFALYHLARNPSVQDYLRNDLVAVSKTKNAEFMDTQYLEGVIKETLRLNPPTIGTGRVTNRQIALQGYRIPSGTFCLLHHQVASKMSLFFDRPLEFLPQRFTKDPMEGLEDIPYKRHSIMASMPFSYGPRFCIGHNLALKEMKIAIPTIVKNFQLSYHHSDIDTVNKLHNEPDKPVLIRFKAI